MCCINYKTAVAVYAVLGFTQRNDVSEKLSVPFSRDKKSWTSCCVKSQRVEISLNARKPEITHRYKIP